MTMSTVRHRACSVLKMGMLAASILLGSNPRAFAADQLVIISPHRKSIQDEFVPVFKEFYKKTYGTDVNVEWLDQGGTSNNIRFVRAKFAKTPATAEVDLFWGGGAATFVELSNDKLLESFALPAEIKADFPETAAGVPMQGSKKTWYATAMSSFGIFYNKKIVAMDKLPEPKTWSDLADPKYLNQLSLADPRQSGSSNTMNSIVLQAMGWDQGWDLLTRIAGNTRKFTHSSSDPIKAIVSGDAAASMAIDFYATPKVQELGPNNLGFVTPASHTVLDPDPIGIIKGAPHRQTAERFVHFLLSTQAQKILMLPKGAPGGPKLSTLGRMAVVKSAYKETEGTRLSPFNPFEQKGFLAYDGDKAARIQRPFNDLIGAIQIDTHEDLKRAWTAIVKRGAKAEEIAELAKPPVTEAELLALADKWDNDSLRNKTINAWVEQAKAKYKKLGGGV